MRAMRQGWSLRKVRRTWAQGKMGKTMALYRPYLFCALGILTFGIFAASNYPLVHLNRQEIMGKTLQLAIPLTVFVGEKVRLEAVVFKENGQPATLTPNGGIWFEVTDGQLEPFTTVEPDIGLVAQEWVAPNQSGVVSITAYYRDPVSGDIQTMTEKITVITRPESTPYFQIIQPVGQFIAVGDESGISSMQDLELVALDSSGEPIAGSLIGLEVQGASILESKIIGNDPCHYTNPVDSTGYFRCVLELEHDQKHLYVRVRLGDAKDAKLERVYHILKLRRPGICLKVGNDGYGSVVAPCEVPLQIEVRDAWGYPMANKEVMLHTTLGKLENEKVVTDSSGYAKTKIVLNQEGIAIIRAECENLIDEAYLEVFSLYDLATNQHKKIRLASTSLLSWNFAVQSSGRREIRVISPAGGVLNLMPYDNKDGLTPMCRMHWYEQDLLRIQTDGFRRRDMII
jgi:hypothetical protein